jgi:hypothetical protein
MDIREQMLGETRRHQWNKEPRLKRVATFWKREDIRQEHLENHRAGDCETNSQIFCQDSKTEGLDIVEGSAPSKKKSLHTE